MFFKCNFALRKPMHWQIQFKLQSQSFSKKNSFQRGRSVVYLAHETRIRGFFKCTQCEIVCIFFSAAALKILYRVITSDRQN